MSDELNLLFRWLHILAAITAVGGTIFARFVVLPSLAVLPPDERGALESAMRARWAKIVAGSIALLLISGLYNIYVIEAYTTAPKVYHWYRPLFGVKFLLAMVIFVIASLLAGKTAAAQRLRRNAPFWMTFNIVLAVTVVCMSGVLRTAKKEPKDPARSAPSEGQSTPVRAGDARGGGY